MKLEEVEAEIRPRLPWEAVDLGCALTRRHWLGLMKAWAVTVVPLWLLLGAVFWNSLGWFVFFCWFLKPVYDKVPLLYLSQTLFGGKPTTGYILKRWPGMIFRDPYYLFARLSSRRAMFMPVRLLEGLRGRAFKERVGLLSRVSGGAESGALFCALLLETAMILAFFGLLALMRPEGVVNWQNPFISLLRNLQDLDLDEGLTYMAALSTGFYLMAVTVIEPFFMGAGFGCYLNARTQLEGWDIELSFRRLGQRLSLLKSGVVASALALFLAGGMFCLSPGNAQAQEETTSRPAETLQESQEDADSQEAGKRDAGVKDGENTIKPKGSGAAVEAEEDAAGDKTLDEARARIDRVLNSPDFDREEKIVKRWVSAESEPAAPPPKSKSWFSDLIDWLFNFASNFGALGQLLMYAILMVLVAFLVWKIWQNKHLFSFDRGGSRSAPPLPRTVMGLNLEEELPADVPGTARAWFAEGRWQEAVSLLYRASIHWLVLRGGLPVRESDTESDCLNHAANLRDPGVQGYFQQLTHRWMDAAYGKLPPAPADMEQLCSQWPFAMKQQP